jgi:hypothetical protein
VKPERIIKKNAHALFLMGLFNYVGWNLVMIELRSVVAQVVHEIDIMFPLGSNFDADDYFSCIMDLFFSRVPPQDLFFYQEGEAKFSQAAPPG